MTERRLVHGYTNQSWLDGGLVVKQYQNGDAAQRLQTRDPEWDGSGAAWTLRCRGTRGQAPQPLRSGSRAPKGASGSTVQRGDPAALRRPL